MAESVQEAELRGWEDPDEILQMFLLILLKSTLTTSRGHLSAFTVSMDPMPPSCHQGANTRPLIVSHPFLYALKLARVC